MNTHNTFDNPDAIKPAEFSQLYNTRLRGYCALLSKKHLLLSKKNAIILK